MHSDSLGKVRTWKGQLILDVPQKCTWHFIHWFRVFLCFRVTIFKWYAWFNRLHSCYCRQFSYSTRFKVFLFIPHEGLKNYTLISSKNCIKQQLACSHRKYFDIHNKWIFCGFQDHTLVGQQDADVQQDIQLSGLGIMPEHCVVDIENGDVWLTPIDGAR